MNSPFLWIESRFYLEDQNMNLKNIYYNKINLLHQVLIQQNIYNKIYIVALNKILHLQLKIVTIVT